MTNRERAKEGRSREYEEIVDEVRKAADGVMPGMSSTEKLRLLLKMKDLKKQLGALAVAVEEKEVTDSEIGVMQECLLDPSLGEPSPLVPLPPNEFFYPGDHRRSPKGHVIGFRGRRSRRIKKGSRIHPFPSTSGGPAEVLIQQECLRRHYEKPIHNFIDLYTTLSEVPFGAHPLLQYGATGVYDVLVLADAKNNSPDTTPTLPKSSELKGALELPQKAPRPLPVLSPSKEKDPPDTKVENSGKCPRSLSEQRLAQALKQDQILLGDNVVINEEQLKKDIIKELPNVCCVDIEHKEDVATGTYSAVLVFTYADTSKGDDMKSKVRVLTDEESAREVHTQSVNVGKEATGPTPVQGTLHHRVPQLDAPELLKAARVTPESSSPPSDTGKARPCSRTKVELMAYFLIAVMFLVPFCVFWCWVYTFL